MNLSKEVRLLIWKEALLEWRKRYALNGILLYVTAAVFTAYLSFQTMEASSWNALFWIIMLFSSVTAISKSFVGEPKGLQIYWYGLSSPQAIILSRIIYNGLLMSVLATICLACYTLLLGNLADNLNAFILVVYLGSWGFSSTFTLISAIASRSGNGNLLMPVLSFPLIIPLLLVVVKASKNAVYGLELSTLYDELGVLLAINVIAIGLSWILFPFLWKQ